jgi:uncharacterized damage-inducible protein DinB
VRENADVRQKALAEKLGRHQSFIAKYEGGERRIDVIEFIAIARALGANPVKLFPVRDTLAHLYTAEWAWYARWQGVSPSAMPPFDQFPDVATLREAWTEQEAKVRAFVDSLGEAGVNSVYEFKMLNGQQTSAVFWHMLQHVANHASYHRGQVTTMLRQLGAEPAKSMDMIRFHRERAVRS